MGHEIRSGKRLYGRVALVTGAGQGIGQAIAMTLATEGAVIAVNDINATTAQETVDMIKGAGGKATVALASVSEEKEVDAMVSSVLSELGKIDILVNNAGIVQPEYIPTIEQSLEKWEKVINIHLRGTFLCCRGVGKWMVQQNHGNVVNMSSMVAFTGWPMRTSYGPAKAGIANLTQNLAVEWAKYNIRVNALAPGMIATPLLENAMRDRGESVEPLKERIPLGRLGTTNDIAKVALFLISDDSAYITGQTLVVDGGWTARGY